MNRGLEDRWTDGFKPGDRISVEGFDEARHNGEFVVAEVIGSIHEDLPAGLVIERRELAKAAVSDPSGPGRRKDGDNVARFDRARYLELVNANARRRGRERCKMSGDQAREIAEELEASTLVWDDRTITTLKDIITSHLAAQEAERAERDEVVQEAIELAVRRFEAQNGRVSREMRDGNYEAWTALNSALALLEVSDWTRRRWRLRRSMSSNNGYTRRIYPVTRSNDGTSTNAPNSRP